LVKIVAFSFSKPPTAVYVNLSKRVQLTLDLGPPKLAAFVRKKSTSVSKLKE